MRYFKIPGVILVIVLIFVTSGNCIRKPSEKVESVKPYVPIRYNIALSANIGVITGEYGDRLKGLDGNINDQIFGGYGASFEYHLKKSFFFSFDFERGIKKYNDITLSGTMFGLGAALKLKNNSATYPYLGGGYGIVKGSDSHYDFDYGNSHYILLKFGYAINNPSKINTKLELYYRMVSLSDEIKDIPFANADENLTAMGVRFILGLGF